jgi:hypothetical protein
MCARPAPAKARRSKPDGRTISAKRFAAIIEAFSKEIGGPLTESESGLVRQAAALALRCEQLQTAIVRGEVIDDDLLVRISGTAKRLLGAISVKSDGKKPAATSLADHFARKAAELASDDEDE